MPELTEELIRKTGTCPKQKRLNCSKTPGFMTLHGKKGISFRARVVVPDDTGKPVEYASVLGKWTDGMTVREARKLAERFIVDTREEMAGRSRNAAQKTDYAAITLQQAFDHMLANKLRNRADKTREQYEYCMTKLDRFKEWSLVDLSKQRTKVQELHSKLTRECGPATANDVFKILRAIYLDAAKRHDELRLDRHPALGLTFNKQKRRQQGLSADELSAWFEEWANTEARPRTGPAQRREYILFQLLSGLRPGSQRAAKWEHLRIDRKALHIPKPKGGEDRAFDLPLSQAMLDCLERARIQWEMIDSTSPYIFPSNPTNRPTKYGVIECTKQDRERMAVNGKLRQTWITQAEQIGIPKLYRMIMVNHTTRDVSDGYVNNSALWNQLLEAQTQMSEHFLGHCPKHLEHLLA